MQSKEEAKECRRLYRIAHKEQRAAYDRKWITEHKEARAAIQRESYQKCRGHRAIHPKKWKQDNPEKAKEISRRHRCKKYGITPEQYDTMFEAQKGVCAICGETEIFNNRRLAIDHDHATGKVRALLCGRCNQGLGNAHEDVHILFSMARYLDSWKSKAV